ncbi:xanthine dehydrogenase small subunit [Parasulfitobacter algicola]|uniref:Xanthine dehydrogenase small subunit n=1 Tax=Parasulfitobacter algicola TaxID=2614809 RepID=A0ABX2IS14_9RHOB|nr:xanthine dehydrogenase small subunit [Sulfitobacter algicola]NSX55100.1 xanthine dehydrogenase small subunit [Sulfitobacter algicola]
MEVTFLLNGETVQVDSDPTHTLLDWLRENRGLTGTKEGCNEGDCGACTVIMTDTYGARTLNACILFMPQLHGKAVRTVEGISGPNNKLHPVQKAMIEHHGSQCGFCTPGFVVSMACAHQNGRQNFDDQLTGNLCRCTGYAPIVRAAQAAAKDPVPDWMADTLPTQNAQNAHIPENADALADWYTAHPDGTLIAGATDVGLWVTKQFRDLGPVAFLHRCADLQQIHETKDRTHIGAACTMTQVLDWAVDHFPSYAEMIRRYGSVQVRNAATIGGNIANGSPIGDNPPALIALGANLHLRQGERRRVIPLETFFLEYGKQDRASGEFIEAISIPQQRDHLKCYKISKRFDQDISALCGCFNIEVKNNRVTDAKIAFGGMAGIPKRAHYVEQALIGLEWHNDAVPAVYDTWPAWEKDFNPLSDMRASAQYRLETARNLLVRYYMESIGQNTSVQKVAP